MQTGQLAKAMEKGDQERPEEHLEAEAKGIRHRTRPFSAVFRRFRRRFGLFLADFGGATRVARCSRTTATS